MDNILYPPARPQSVGELLDQAFRIYRATLMKCLLFAALAQLSRTILSLYRFRGATTQGVLMAYLEKVRDPVFWLLYLVCACATTLLLTMVLLRQYRMASGAAAGGELQPSVRRALRLLGLGLLILLAALIVGAALGAGPALVGRGVVLVLIVLLALFVSYGLVALSCTMTALVVDDIGIIASLRRSVSLTSGSFWRLSLIYTVALAFVVVLYIVAGGVAGVVAIVVGRGDVAVAVTVSSVVVLLAGALVLPFYTALALAIYGDLIVRKEGADLERRIASAA